MDCLCCKQGRILRSDSCGGLKLRAFLVGLGIFHGDILVHSNGFHQFTRITSRSKKNHLKTHPDFPLADIFEWQKGTLKKKATARGGDLTRYAKITKTHSASG